MPDITFEIDLWALLTLLVISSIFFFFYRSIHLMDAPKLLFSNFHDLKTGPISWRARLSRLPNQMRYAALIFFIIAFLDPHFHLPRQRDAQTSSQGIILYLVIDQSGSMNEKVHAVSSKGKFETVTKIELLKQFTSKFVNGRPNDLIGLVAFARTAHVLAPLTLDRGTILQKLEGLKTVQNKDDDGTAIGYAIFKTVNLIAATRHYGQNLTGPDLPAYDIKGAAIVLITDAFHSPNPLDNGNPLRSTGVLEAATYAKEKNVHLYIINIEPALSAENFAPNRRLMQHATELTGGKFYLMEGDRNLGQIYTDIDTLEKSTLPPQQTFSKDKQPHLYYRLSLYPVFICLGLLAFLLSIMLETLSLRRLP